MCLEETESVFICNVSQGGRAEKYLPALGKCDMFQTDSL